MTPTYCSVFLLVLALVGRAASVPRPLVVDACALLCNPGAETESERERDPVYFPRYPKVNCRLQSESDEHQAFAIASHCLKLCNFELSIASEVNCFALRSSLQANLGCYCEALTPLSPNTMRLHETWRLNHLVKELATDILDVILKSPIDVIILCEIHTELFKTATLNGGRLVQKCIEENSTRTSREKRSVKESEMDSSNYENVMNKLQSDDHDDIVEIDTVTDEMDMLFERLQPRTERRIFDDINSDEEDNPEKDNTEDSFHEDLNTISDQYSETEQSCRKLCKKPEPGNSICHCSKKN